MNVILPLTHKRTAIAPEHACLMITLLLALLLYRDTAYQLFEVWRSSATFAHGMLVPLVSVWLIWRERAVWCALAACPEPLLLGALLFLGSLWYVGVRQHIAVLAQFSLISTLIALWVLWQGWQRARSQYFALAFLLLAIPCGEFLIPHLVQLTTSFVVLGLTLCGIAVYREGNLLTLATGSWSVADACSGLRYLIATLAIASLYVHLGIRGRARQCGFMLIALVLPIAANCVRAFAIVLLGHYSEMRYAAGADHLLYGALFFTILLTLLLAIGQYFRTAPEVLVIPAAGHGKRVGPRRLARPALLLAVVSTLLFWPGLRTMQAHGWLG